MKLNLFIRFLCLVGMVILLWYIYVNTTSEPKKLPKESYKIQQNFDSIDLARIEFTKNYFEAVKNRDKSKVRELSIGNFPFTSTEDRDTQFNKFWRNFEGRNLVFSQLIKID